VSKIIVGIGQTERDKDAVALAAALARSSGAEIVLVCAYMYEAVPSRASSSGYRQYLREDAEKAIQAAQQGIPGLPSMVGARSRTPRRRGASRRSPSARARR
jgi:hypothetical protein